MWRYSIAVLILAVRADLSRNDHRGRRGREKERCRVVEPMLLIYNRLPWFRSLEVRNILKNASTIKHWEYLWTGWDKDLYTSGEGLRNGDALSSHGDPVKVAQTIREIQNRATPKQRQRLVCMERSFSYLEVPGIVPGRLGWMSIIEDPVERSARAFPGSAKELDTCVKKMGPAKCVPLNSMTQWFCGGGPMCDTKTKRGLAALVRAKLVLQRDYAFVGIREYWDASLKLLARVLPTYFAALPSHKLNPRLDHGYSRAHLLQPATREAILQANNLDAVLYEHAVSILDQALRFCFNTGFILGQSKKFEESTSVRDQKMFSTKTPLRPQEYYTGSLAALADSITPGNGLAGTCLQRRILRQHVQIEENYAQSNRTSRNLLEEEEDAGVICFPSVLGIGGSRCGLDVVTSLLSSHPSVIVPEGPLRYFGQARRRGKRGLLSYARNFPVTKDTKMIGFESSPETYLNRRAIFEMKEILGPRLKLIFALREPIARAYDDFWRHVRGGRFFQHEKELFLCYKETADDSVTHPSCASRGSPVHARMVSPLVFDAYTRQVLLDAWEPALQSTARRAPLNDSIPSDFELGVTNDNIFAKSLYAPQLQRLLLMFDPTNIHLIVYEHLLSPTQGPATLATLLDFLRIPYHRFKDKSIQVTDSLVYDANSIIVTTARLAAHHASRSGSASVNDPGPKKAHHGKDASTELLPYPPVLRKTRRILEAFFSVDTELVRRMFPTLELPW